MNVLGTRAAGRDAFLFHPLGLWASRDCRLAAGLADAVALVPGGELG